MFVTRISYTYTLQSTYVDSLNTQHKIHLNKKKTHKPFYRSNKLLITPRPYYRRRKH